MLNRIVCAAVTLFLSVTIAQSLPISTRTKVSCMTDYYRFCQGWPNDELRKCFQMNVLRVSVTCTEALVDEGLISKVEVDTMKRQAIAMMNAKPIIKSVSSPPINPNPTVEDIKNSAKKVVVNKKTTSKKKTKPTTVASVPKKAPDPNFERWKRQNGF